MSSRLKENCQSNKHSDITRVRVGRKNNPQLYKQESARKFVSWYERMIDNERPNLRLYLAENVTLEWFGRTIKSKKKVSAFFNNDMQCSRHDFKTVETIDKIQSRAEVQLNKDDSVLASPLQSPEFNTKKLNKRILTFCSGSPEWADDEDTFINNGKKRLKKRHVESMVYEETDKKTNCVAEDQHFEVNNQGDGVIAQQEHKFATITPPNMECGQGDCLPSTSGTAEKCQDSTNGQLMKLAVECNGFVEFIKSKNNHNIDTAKWDRKCKVQISYSEDPLHLGEYIVWAIVYNDESKCRRNLLAAFEEAARDEEKDE